MLEALLGLLAQVRDAPTRHPTRKRIMALLEQDPGRTLTALREDLGCSWGTIQHHTRTLERRGVVRSEPVGRSRRFFLATVSAAERHGRAVLRRGRVDELVSAICAQPGRMQRDLTDDLNLTRKVLRGYVDHLVEAGLVVERQHPKTRTYHPTELLRSLLRELEEDAARPRDPVTDLAVPRVAPS